MEFILKNSSKRKPVSANQGKATRMKSSTEESGRKENGQPARVLSHPRLKGLRVDGALIVHLHTHLRPFNNCYECTYSMCIGPHLPDTVPIVDELGSSLTFFSQDGYIRVLTQWKVYCFTRDKQLKSV